MTLDDNFKLFFKDNALTYGDSTDVGQSIDSLSPFNVGISNQAELPNYYIKVIYEFDGLTSGISFGANTYQFDGYTMSALTNVSGDEYVFESISTTSVAKGTAINILQYLQNFTFSSDEDFKTVTPLNFTITLIVDNSNTFDNIHKNEISYTGEIGFDHNKAYTLQTVSLNMNGGNGDNEIRYSDNQFMIIGEMPASEIGTQEFYFFADTLINDSNFYTLDYAYYNLNEWYDMPNGDTILYATYLTPNVSAESENTVNIKNVALEHNITNAVVASNVKTIVGDTNANSTLTRVILPPTVNTLTNNAFNNCLSLDTIILPKSIENISSGTFTNCAWYENRNSSTDGIYQDGELVYIQKVLYDGGQASGEITLKDDTVAITNSAFENLDGLTKVVMLQGLKHIGANAFNGCTNLANISIPSSVETIDENAFNNTLWFANKTNGADGINIVDGVIYIQRVLYDGTNSTNYVNVKDDTLSITPQAFSNNTTLETIILNDGLKEIGDRAFNGCTSLTNINIPSSVNTIGTNILYGCTSLTSIKVVPNNDNYEGNSQNTLLIETKTSSIIAGCNTPSLQIPAGVKAIGANAFRGNTEITSLTFEDGCQIVDIGSGAFMGCVGLSGNLNIPSSVKSIGANAFDGCSGIQNLNFAQDSLLETIGADAFNGCSGITNELKLPSSVTSIGNRAFDGCSSISGNLALPIGLTVIGVSVFNDCSNLSGDLIIPVGVTTIGASAFRNCSALNGRLYIPYTVISISNDAFNGCTNISLLEIDSNSQLQSIGNRVFSSCSNMEGELFLPATLRTIGVSAFSGCSNLSGTINIPEGVNTINTNAFRNCSSITGVVYISSSVTNIAGDAFNGCTGLSGIQIAEGSQLTTIGNRAFYNCTQMSGELIIPNTVNSIGLSAFYNCSNLTQITCNALTPPTLGTGVFNNTNCNIYVPNESVEAYKSATNWSTYATRIQAIA